jgi:transcription initiation factor IIE alpha subunit
MDHVICSQCGYKVGLGMACEPGHCPECDQPLLHTSEFRALTTDDLKREVERQRKLEAERRIFPLV